MAPKAVPGNAADAPAPWTLLVVDDDPMVHAVTRMALTDLVVEGRPVELLEATDTTQARALVLFRPEIALMLIDVCLAGGPSGLDLVRFVRGDLRRRAVRLVLRTGDSCDMPPAELAERYEIDDYRNKTELTYDRLRILVRTAVRTYRILRELEEGRPLDELFRADTARHRRRGAVPIASAAAAD